MKQRDNYAIAAVAAQKRFADFDHAAIAQKLGCKTDGEYLYIRMLSKKYRIALKDGKIFSFSCSTWEETANFNEIMTLLDLVCDSSVNRRISGKWMNMSSFGRQFHQTLLEQESSWARFLQANPQKLADACTSLHASPCTPGDAAFAIPLFEDLNVMLQLWYGDDEFPANIRWLWDENALMYLKYETMYYAVNMIRAELEKQMGYSE